MGAMNKLRENTGVILWILVLSFGIIWTLQDSNVFDAMNQPTRNVATVNGTPIRNQEYNRVVDQLRQRYQQKTGGQLPSRLEEQMREQAYTQVVNNALLEQEMERLGITVTNSEVENMVFGENPHRIIRQQFADSTGQINYQLLRNMAQNPQAKSQWLQLEDYLRKQRRQRKITSLVQSTVNVSEQDIKDYHWRQNAEASAQYVALRYASVPDDSIRVRESDLRSYYDENKDDFKRKKTVTLKYVSLSKTATAEDTAAVLDDLKNLQEDFATAENDSLFLREKASERSYGSEFVTPDGMDASVADVVYQDATPGRIAGPIVGSGLAHLVKIVDVRPADQAYARAAHILLKSSGVDTELRDRLQSIRDRITSGAATFSEMARQYSEDQSASDGGDLGWFAENTMTQAFDQATFGASPGEIVGPIRSEFGYHLIKVKGRASQAVNIADLAYDLSPSQATLTDKQNKLEDVAFYAGDNSSFSEEAKRRNLEVQEVESEADQSAVPGIGQSRALTSFMEKAETGNISEVVNLEDKFVVAKVTNVKPEGYRPFDEVKAQIRPRVELQKKKKIQVRRMRAALNRTSFEELGSALNTQMRTQTGITFTTETVPGVGRDPAFAGTVFGLEEGERSGVVAGKNASFVVRITNMKEVPELTASQRKQIRQQLLRERRKQVSSQWLAALREDATIKDQRRPSQ